MPHSALPKKLLLRELIPICANCGRIRNEASEWEVYEGDVSDIDHMRLTHGICPICAHELYPEIFPTVVQMSKC